MAAYCEALMQQVHLQSTAGSASTVEELLNMRRDSIATTPIYALIESAFSSVRKCSMLTNFRYAYGLELPEEVIEHPSIQRIEKTATDIVLM